MYISRSKSLVRQHRAVHPGHRPRRAGREGACALTRFAFAGVTGGAAFCAIGVAGRKRSGQRTTELLSGLHNTLLDKPLEA